MKKWLIFFLLSASALLVYYNYFYNRAFLEIGLTTDLKRSFLQIYWADDNQPFSEDRSIKIKLYGGKKRHYSQYFTDMRKVRKLKIDPLQHSGNARLHYLILSQEEFDPIKLDGKRFKQLVVVNDISHIDYSKNSILIKSTGTDPGLIWNISPQFISNKTITEWFRVILILVVSWYIAAFLTVNNNDFYKIFQILGWPVLGFILIMATTTYYNKHPDEYVHISAGRYYENEWLPPEICIPGTENTYSVYGVSRLNSKEIFYFLAGKLSSLFYLFPIRDYMRLRFVNVILFLCLVILFSKNLLVTMLFTPLLISPQVWYIFSYFNSDAFSLFVAFIICYQIVSEKSYLKKCWDAPQQDKWSFFHTTVCGMMFGLIYFTKQNYYILFVYFGGYFLLEYFFNHYKNKISWIKVGGFLTGVVAISIVGLSPHIIVNGYDRDTKLSECRERLARKPYKPSTPLEQKWPGIYLKEKGFSLNYVLQEKKWGEKIFRSFFGVYGYTTYAGSTLYYYIMKILVIFFLSLIVLMIIYYANNIDRILLAWTIICSMVLIGLTLWKAWTADFQAQGRYLMPILPMLGMLMYREKRILDRPIIQLNVILLFLASCYSFVFFGIKQIPKI